MGMCWLCGCRCQWYQIERRVILYSFSVILRVSLYQLFLETLIQRRQNANTYGPLELTNWPHSSHNSTLITEALSVKLDGAKSEWFSLIENRGFKNMRMSLDMCTSRKVCLNRFGWQRAGVRGIYVSTLSVERMSNNCVSFNQTIVFQETTPPI
jgi:hypothetical protein